MMNAIATPQATPGAGDVIARADGRGARTVPLTSCALPLSCRVRAAAAGTARGRAGLLDHASNCVGQDVAEHVKPTFPDRPVLDDPALDRTHRAGFEPAGADPASLLEPAGLEHAEVLQHGR